MKRLPARATLVLALVLAAAPRHARADTYPRQRGVDVLQYTFALSLGDETDEVEGETTVEFRVLQDGLATLVLDLVQPKPDAPGKGMSVDRKSTRLNSSHLGIS